MLIWTHDSLRLPSVSVLVSLVLSKLYPSFPSHCHSSLRLLSGLLCFSLLFFLCSGLLTCLLIAACLCVLWDETIRNLLSVTFPYPRSLLHVSLLAFLLVSKWSPYISSLHCRASFQVSSMWDFSTLPFLSLLVPLVFPSAFFTSLLITVVLSGCFWDTGLSLSPVCFPILPHSRILVAFLGGYTVLFSIDDFGGLQKSNKILRKGTTPPVCFPILPHSLIWVVFWVDI